MKETFTIAENRKENCSVITEAVFYKSHFFGDYFEIFTRVLTNDTAFSKRHHSVPAESITVEDFADIKKIHKHIVKDYLK